MKLVKLISGHFITCNECNNLSTLFLNYYSKILKAKEIKKRHRSRKHKVRALKKGRSTYEPLDEKFNKEIDEMTQHERLEFDRSKEHGFILMVYGGCRLPRQHKPTRKFKRLPFSSSSSSSYTSLS